MMELKLYMNRIEVGNQYNTANITSINPIKQNK